MWPSTLSRARSLLIWPGLRSGICGCGSDMVGHPVWDNHAATELIHWPDGVTYVAS